MWKNRGHSYTRARITDLVNTKVWRQRKRESYLYTGHDHMFHIPSWSSHQAHHLCLYDRAHRIVTQRGNKIIEKQHIATALVSMAIYPLSWRKSQKPARLKIEKNRTKEQLLYFPMWKEFYSHYDVTFKNTVFEPSLNQRQRYGNVWYVLRTLFPKANKTVLCKWSPVVIVTALTSAKQEKRYMKLFRKYLLFSNMPPWTAIPLTGKTSNV